MSDNLINWTPDLLAKLKREYTAAVETEKKQFVFDDGEKPHMIVTKYAKYLIEYLDDYFGIRKQDHDHNRTAT